MPGSVEVIVPWRGGCVHRGTAWGWARGAYVLNGWQVTIAEAPEGPWSKASAVMPAVERSEADVIVVADADVWCDGLQDAVRAVQNGSAWARPHNLVIRLTEEGTARYMAGESCQGYFDRKPYNGVDGGGILVAHRQTLLEVPMDPRFTNWGNEDWAWGFAFFALKGPIWRGNHSLVHLWHPPEPRTHRQHGSEENQGLWRRYKAARSNHSEMHRLLEEARGALAAAKPGLHNHQELGVG